MILALWFWSVFAHATVECSRGLEIPVVASECLDAPPGPAWLEKCREAHARVGPIFSHRMIPKPIVGLVPVFKFIAKIPGPWRDPASRIVRMIEGLSGEAIHVTSPELIEAIARAPESFGREYDRMAFDRTLGPDGILLLEDSEEKAWSTAHAALAPAFSARFVRENYSDLIHEAIEDGLQRHGATDGALAPTGFAERVSATVMYNILFGRDLPEEIFEELARSASAVWAGRVEKGKTRTAFREAFEDHAREIFPTVHDGLAWRLRIDNPERSESWWMDQITTLMFAASDTTRAAMSWLLWDLARHPEWQARLRGPNATRDARLFVAESQRQHTIIGTLTRLVKDDVKIGPYLLKKGALVFLNFHDLHLTSFDEPRNFDPDRFADSELPKFAHCPFGYGRRVCIGQHLAMAELEAAITIVAGRFDVSTDRTTVERDRSRGGPMAVDTNLRLRLEPRKD